MPANVRYIVTDVEVAIAFYKDILEFEVEIQGGTGFARLALGDLRLNINRPGAGGAGASMPDGRVPAPGGWNRIMVEVDDLEATVATMRRRGAAFRNDIVIGNGGKQILLEDPSGNAIELFQPFVPGSSEAPSTARGTRDTSS